MQIVPLDMFGHSQRMRINLETVVVVRIFFPFSQHLYTDLGPHHSYDQKGFIMTFFRSFLQIIANAGAKTENFPVYTIFLRTKRITKKYYTTDLILLCSNYIDTQCFLENNF